MNIEDYWEEEDFEDTVAAALISCFETNVKRNKGAAPSDRLTSDRVALFRSAGPYISSDSRFLEVPTDLENGTWHFDVVNDPLPVSGCYGMRPNEIIYRENDPNCYFLATYVRKAVALGKYWQKRRSGTLYEMLCMSANDKGIDGERRYFTVSNRGEVISCTQKIPTNSRGVSAGEKVEVAEHDEKWLRETSAHASIALQSLADKRFCWTITAQEKIAKAHLGCMQEEVKSLLYARSLPMTETGRKRPILHLVESHKRRMRNGTEIDISSFLRGQQTVEFGGTLFKVNPPAVMRPLVSTNSQDKYFQKQP